MSRSTRALIYLKRAEDSLAVSDMAFKTKYEVATINRAYYAIDYAISALLTLLELSPKSHSGTITLFNKEYIKTGIMEKKMNQITQKAFDMRQKRIMRLKQ